MVVWFNILELETWNEHVLVGNEATIYNSIMYGSLVYAILKISQFFLNL